MKYIGNELQDRMNMLDISVSSLADLTFMDEEIISGVLANKIAYEEIDEYDMALICSALHCDVDYFVDCDVRNKDLLISTRSREKDSVKSNHVKAKIQDAVNDYAFVQEALLDEI